MTDIFDLAVSEEIPLNASTSERKTLYVTKRDGRLEEVSFDKISERLSNVCETHKINCNHLLVAQGVIRGLVDGIKTSELDELACKIAFEMHVRDIAYADLASALEISNIHKMTKGFYAASTQLHKEGRLDPRYWEYVKRHGKYLEKKVIKYNRDYKYDYVGIQALKKGILLKDQDENILERPQDVLMRQALMFYGDDIYKVKKCYKVFSKRQCVHGTPTQMNAGLTNQFSSCFLFCLDPSTTASKHTTIQECAVISENSGGSGGNCSLIPAEGTIVNGDPSKGVMSFLKLLDTTIGDASTDRRKSSAAIYLDITHADVLTFIGVRLKERPEELKVRHIHPALMIPDLFFRRVMEGGMWSMFCPYKTPGLMESWGAKYEELYLKYEREGKYIKQVSARDLFVKIASVIQPTGGPFIIAKDTCNRLSNQQHLGTLMSFNLCTEVAEVATKDETAVCNLASVSLPECLVDGEFDHQLLHDIVRQITFNLNRVIDLGKLPSEKARKSNEKTRSIGIGISGLADLFLLMEMPFDSPEARQLNLEIAETMYYAFVRASCDLAKEEGWYPVFPGSLTSKGILNYHLHNHKPTNRWDFATLEKDVVQYGMRNSMGIAPMPTSTGSQLVGNNESFEPFTAYVVNRKFGAGNFLIVNPKAVALLKKYKCWSPAKNWMLEHQGSVKGCPDVPQKVQDILKTVWDIKPSCMMNMSADRNIFTDQSQSFSQHIAESDASKIMLMLLYAWECGLKTCMYYCRSKAPTESASIIVDAGNDPICAGGACTV